MAKIALGRVNQKPRDLWRGHFAYLFNEAVGGKRNQGIIAVWYAWITAESGRTIYGNNPMNMTCSSGDGCYAGQIGWYQFPGNSRKFAAFATPEDGARAVASLLTIQRYRYPPIVKAARAGDYQAMIEAISASCWVSCARPGYVRGSIITLYSIWNGLRRTVAAEWPDLPRSPVSGGEAGATVGAAGGAKPKGKTITLPFGTIIRGFQSVTGSTPTTDFLLGAWYDVVAPLIVKAIGGTPTKEAEAAWGRDVLAAAQTYRNTPAGKLPDNLTVTLSSAAQATNVDPLTALANTASTAAALLAKLFDPQTYVRTGALALGFVLLLLGFRMLIDASSGEAPAPVAA